MAFLGEVQKLRDAGLPVDGQLFVSNRAQVILPYHRMIELAAETAPGRQPIGTTRRGIGPAYEDKIHRNGLRVVDLLNTSLLRTHINNACHEKNTIAHALFGTEPLDPRQMYEEYARAAEQIAPFVTDTAVPAEPRHRRRPERDVRGRAGCAAGHRPRNVPLRHQLVLHGGRRGHRHRRRPHRIGTVIGVTKAYVTRVGEGPFPTEIDGYSAELLRARGQEYGAVTGRPRRCGWLDLPLLRYSNMINSTEWLVVTKMDVMDECAEIPVCTGYKIDGKVTDVIPADVRGFKAIHPIYTTLKGWKCSTEGITEYDKLPKRAQEYLQFIERESGAQDRHDLHRPRPRADHDPAGV
jgi:adenylosuccinate synthase